VRFGVNLIHEPVLSGELAGNLERVFTYPQDPSFYVANPGVLGTCASTTPNPNCPTVDATGPFDGLFTQSIRRLGFYGEDSWRVTPSFTLNAGLRYDTTFRLFIASGHDQSTNPALAGNGVVSGVPHDYRKAVAPRLGIAYAPHGSATTVFRAGAGLYYNDLAQNGWVGAFQAVNAAPGPCTDPAGDPGLLNPSNAGCLPGANFGGQGAIIDPHYRTPHALHAGAGAQHAFNEQWTLSADWTHESGTHAYRAYPFAGGDSLFTPLTLQPGVSQAEVVPNINVYKSDNRSSYDAVTFKLQGNLPRLNLVAHYTLAKAQTWGCTVGELFDYVNGVCDPRNPFAPGDYGPSGEDVRHRFVLAGTAHLPGGFEVSTLTQLESARPFTLANGGERAVIHGVKTKLDQFRGTPYMQVDLRVARPFKIGERAQVNPFVEFFNLFNRNNPANNYVADVGALNVPADQIANGNITDLCGDPTCSPASFIPITSLNQLRKPAGALGDFFGPGTTVGIPFAAQVGVRVTF
jgi:hypothetical protein